LRIHSDGKTIFLNAEEVKKLCRPGAGADTCIWLVSRAEEFACIYYNRAAQSSTGESIEEMWKKGLTVAKRDGCDVVRSLERKLKGLK